MSNPRNSILPAKKGPQIRRQCNLYLGKIQDLCKVIHKEYPDCKPCYEATANANIKVTIEMIKTGFFRNYTKVKKVLANTKHPLLILRLLRALNKYTNNRQLAVKLQRVVDHRIVELVLKKEETDEEIRRQFEGYSPDLTSEVIYADWLRTVNGLDID
jgi:hypothetical protein